MQEVELKTKIGEDHSLVQVVRSEIREMDSNGDASTGSAERMKQRVSWIVEIESNMKRYVQVEQRPKIQKVPMTIREIESNKKCFDPMVIAIGPLHHGKPELERMETFKIQFALQYAHQSKKSMKELYDAVEKQAFDARNCYAKGSTDAFDDEKEFAKMMFLDSCFVLQFIYSCVNPAEDDVKMKINDKAFILRDITLLENQLPFEFLKALMKLRFEGGEGEQMIDDFIRLIMEENAKPKGGEKEKEEPVHLLELVRTKFVDVDEITRGSCDSSSNWCSYRSVTELKSVGINFKCSYSRRFSDITFKSGSFLSGYLRLPPITIDDGTKSLLLNLVAWEACPDTPDDFGVSSYVYFMDTLIDRAEDVKELRYNGVILNGLGSDEQAAELFNEIGRNLVSNPQAFGKVKESIYGYYSSRPSLWLAEWVHTHFRSPWALIAFIAAIFVLCLTVAQTVLSALQ
ncbi:UPF0481 protein At3g47200-like [Diospyros lotus]|uniref:UPF0481 protein At3g47200-like n=1 Tax=Diospyros lotus TaxID=55363 RepID=UPI0022582676|nr:UPF0481 protein At3g47200-like [Diospyros lotus]